MSNFTVVVEMTSYLQAILVMMINFSEIKEMTH